MAGLGVQFVNFVRDAALSPQERQERETVKAALSLVKLAAVVSGVVAAAFFSLLPSFFMAILSGIAIVGARDVYIAATNCMEILDNAMIEAQIRGSDEAKITQVTKNTLTLEPLVRVLATYN